MVDNNFVETIISLPANLFYGTSIAVNILVLAKNKPNTNFQFIDASSEEFFKKETNNNVLLDIHIQRVVEIFDKKENIDYVAASVIYEDIVENNYNLSVSSYIEAKDTSEVIDIIKLNAEINATTERIDQLRVDLKDIIAEIDA